MTNPTSKCFLRACKGLEMLGGRVCCWLTWLLMMVLNPAHSREEIRKQEMDYIHQDTEAAAESETATTDFRYESAFSYYKTEIDRGRSIDEKNKVLLTAAALLLATVGALAPKVAPAWLVVLPAVPVLITLYLVLVHFGVQAVPVPQWDCRRTSCDDDAKRKLIDSFFSGGRSLGIKNDFRVGVYRAALRSLLVGVGLITLLFVAVVMSPSDESDILKKLQENREVRELLRGVPGPPGPRGMPRMQGPKGCPCPRCLRD